MQTVIRNFRFVERRKIHSLFLKLWHVVISSGPHVSIFVSKCKAFSVFFPVFQPHTKKLVTETLSGKVEIFLVTQFLSSRVGHRKT